MPANKYVPWIATAFVLCESLRPPTATDSTVTSGNEPTP